MGFQGALSAGFPTFGRKGNMGRDQKRLEETFDYIKGIRSISLGHFGRMRLPLERDMQAAKAITLGFRGIPTNKQKTQTRHALRALLLCLYWCGQQNSIQEAKKHYANAGEAELQDAVSAFFPLRNANKTSILSSAISYAPAPSAKLLTNLHLRGRGAVAGGRIPMGGNCYSAVATWIYLGGVVSLKWLQKYGGQPDDDLPPAWKWGQPFTSLTQAANVPAGSFCRFLRGTSGVHYALAVGGGDCVGLNQSVDACVHWLAGYG